MAIPLLTAMGIGGGLGILSAYAQVQSQNAEFVYKKSVKKQRDKFVIADLRKAGHDALLAKDELYRQAINTKADVSTQVSDAVSNAVVQQAASGVTGNTAARMTDSIYAAGADMTTSLDLEARAEEDNIAEQVAALAEATKRELISGQPVSFQSGLGTSLQIATGAAQGAQTGLSFTQGIRNLSTK